MCATKIKFEDAKVPKHLSVSMTFYSHVFVVIDKHSHVTTLVYDVLLIELPYFLFTCNSLTICFGIYVCVLLVELPYYSFTCNCLTICSS